MFEAFNELSNSTGIQVDILKTIFGLLASSLLSPLYRLIHQKSLRNFFSIVVGFSFLFFIIEEWAFFILGSILVPYWLMQLSRRPFIVSVVCSFFLLLIVHGYRFVNIYSIWRVDCSVFIMLLVTKLTYYGKWLEKKQGNEKPAIIDYIGYNLYFPGVIAGPTFSFEIYLDFINQKFDTSFKSMKLYKTLEPLLIALLLAGLAFMVIPYFHPRWVLQNQFYLSLNIISKILILNVVGFFYRLKYYAGWYFAQGATNLSGLSLSASGEYDAVVAVSLKFETESNPRSKTQYWNASNQEWLKNVVFESLSTNFGNNIAFFGTFLISAYWHGIYLTYYVGFALWGIFLHLNKWIYKWSLAFPKLSNSLPVRWTATLIGSCFFNYIGMFLAILNWDDAVAFHSALYFCGTIALLVLLLLSMVIKPPRAKKE